MRSRFSAHPEGAGVVRHRALGWPRHHRHHGGVLLAGGGVLLATAGPLKRQAGPPPSLRVLRSDKVKEEKVVQEMAQPPVKCVGREEEAPDAAAAQIGEEEEDGRESKQQSS